jgi:hypothetical protein
VCDDCILGECHRLREYNITHFLIDIVHINQNCFQNRRLYLTRSDTSA